MRRHRNLPNRPHDVDELNRVDLPSACALRCAEDHTDFFGRRLYVKHTEEIKKISNRSAFNDGAEIGV